MEVCRRSHNLYDLLGRQKQAPPANPAQFLATFPPTGNPAGSALQFPLAAQVSTDVMISDYDVVYVRFFRSLLPIRRIQEMQRCSSPCSSAPLMDYKRAPAGTCMRAPTPLNT